MPIVLNFGSKPEASIIETKHKIAPMVSLRFIEGTDKSRMGIGAIEIQYLFKLVIVSEGVEYMVYPFQMNLVLKNNWIDSEVEFINTSLHGNYNFGTIAVE